MRKNQRPAKKPEPTPVWKGLHGAANSCTSCLFAEGVYLSTEPPFPQKWWCKKHDVAADATCTDYVPDPDYVKYGMPLDLMA